MSTAEVDGRSIHYERRGEGEPLLLVQGMAGHHALWREDFLGELAQVFDIVAFDHRGIGDSTDSGADFTIAELAADAVAVLDAVGWSDAHVLGISLGGMVAQELALGFPERVRTLVLGCTYCGGIGSTLAAAGPLRMMQAMGAGNVDAALRVAFAVNLSREYTARAENFAPFKTTSLSVRVPVPVVVRQAKAAFGHDTSLRLPGVTAPTLVLHGTADEMLDYSNGAMIAGLIPGARMHTFDDVGHLFWWEQPQLSAKLVREHCLG